MMHSYLRVLFATILIGVLVWGCSSDTDPVGATDADSDTDADTDADTDSDTDSDTDTDGDADTDADSDTDADGDSDADSDTDTDGDADADSDADSDADADTGNDDTAADTTGDTCGIGATPVERYGQLQVAGAHMQDECGNNIQLKGPSSMWLNWEDDGFAESRHATEFMRDNWGAEIIRAAMGIDPEGAYLSDPGKARRQVTTIVDNAIALGMYVIIDWHDHHGEDNQTEAMAFFEDMAQTYGDLPNVIYEPYNEPLQVSWSQVLKPYHEAVIGAIRAEDDDNIIILGTPNWSQFVNEAAMDPIPGSNLMYTLHFYACTHTEELRDDAQRAYEAGLPMFVTEWGATHADGGLDGIVCEDEATMWHDWLDSRMIGWTAWKLDACADSSCILSDGASQDGPWTNLHGHGDFVVRRMQQ